MSSASQTLEDCLSGRYGPVVIRHRFELLNTELEPIADISSAVEQASINLDNGRAIVRTCQLGLRPQELPSAFGEDTDRLAVYAEALVGAAWIRMPLGVFVLDRVNEVLTPRGNERWHAQGVDLSSRLWESEISQPYTLPAGSNYVEAVAAICQALGLGTHLEASPYATPARFVWAPGTTRGAIANDLLMGINYYPIWATADGLMRSRERLDPYTETSSITYSTERTPRMVHYGGITRARERGRFINRAIVSVTDPGRAPAAVQVTNDDQDSVVSTVNKDAITVQNVPGDRIVNTTVMAAVGASILRDAAAKAQTATLLTFPDPRRDAHEFYTVEIDDREESTPWRAEAWTYECRTGATMTHRIARANRVDVSTEVLV